jgi:hypothetical protein
LGRRVRKKTKNFSTANRKKSQEFSPLAFKMNCGVCGCRLSRRVNQTVKNGLAVHYKCRGFSTYGYETPCFHGSMKENLSLSFVLDCIKNRLEEFLKTAKSPRKVWSEKAKIRAETSEFETSTQNKF